MRRGAQGDQKECELHANASLLDAKQDHRTQMPAVIGGIGEATAERVTAFEQEDAVGGTANQLSPLPLSEGALDYGLQTC